MYKIRDVAKLLNVNTVEIHKKIISLKSDLSGHVVKESGITRIDDKGIEIISRSFLSNGETEIISQNVSDDLEKTDLKPNSVHEIVEEGIEDLEDASVLKIKSRINEVKSQITSLDQDIYRETKKIKEYSEQLNEKLNQLATLLNK